MVVSFLFSSCPKKKYYRLPVDLEEHLAIRCVLPYIIFRGERVVMIFLVGFCILPCLSLLSFLSFSLCVSPVAVGVRVWWLNECQAPRLIRLIGQNNDCETIM